MTDWVVQSVIFMSKTTQKQPENGARLPKYCPEKLKNPPKKRSSKWRTRDCPNTAQIYLSQLKDTFTRCKKIFKQV